jgi:hypothetical protein
VPGDTGASDMILAVSKEDLLKREAKWKRAPAGKTRAKMAS